MFGRYASPGDDLIYRLQPTLSADTVDPEYPLTNWYEVKPSKPAKLTTTDGRIVADFGSPVNVAASALFYHNLDPDYPVTVEWNSVDSWAAPVGAQSFTVPAVPEDLWPISPWMLIDNAPTYQYWSLSLGIQGSPGGSPIGANSLAISIGRWALLGALRDLGNDVRWGVEEQEQHTIIQHDTDLGVDTIYPLGGKRRRWSGEFALRDQAPYEHAQELIALFRSAQMRVKPWVLVPNVDVNDAWIVRFEDDTWSRVREWPNQNLFPFRVRELSRGLPFP